MIRFVRMICLAAAIFLIAACRFDGVGQAAYSAHPDANLPAPQVHSAPSPQSENLRLHYAHLERQSITAGRMRTDGAAFGSRLPSSFVADVFFRLAFSDEVGEHTRPLQKWTQPMKVGMVFGPSVTSATQTRMIRDMVSLTQDLIATTGHPIVLASPTPNAWVFVVNEGERRALAPTIRSIAPWMRAKDMAQITHLPRANQCLMMTFDMAQQHHRDLAIIVIREELTALGQKACLHEEIAQAMGLSDDSDFARPSVFNDDDQFALLTALDRRLLALLYAPQLHPGLTAGAAEPIIAAMDQSLNMEPTL